MQKLSLFDIAIIKTGYFGKPSNGGSVAFLQVRDFSELHHPLDKKQTDKINYTKGIERHLLKENDILLAAKGANNFAVLPSLSIPAVASTSFIVIRLKDQNIFPDFLVRFFNLDSTQNIIKSFAKGSVIPSIPIKQLEGLQIPILDLDKQTKIIDLMDLHQKEISLTRNIIKLKSSLFNHHITQLLK